MTAARQERKSYRRCWVFARVLWAVALAAGVGFALPVVRRAAADVVVVNRYTGLAIDGVDPVSYFVDGIPKVGRAALELQSGGAIWRFRNQGNRAAFAAAPGVYRPRFGGHDPMAVARGVATPGHPALWLIVGNRLYLFDSARSRKAFAKDPAAAIEAAKRHWPEVSRTLLR
jgi:hypothetical protein